MIQSIIVAIFLGTTSIQGAQKSEPKFGTFKVDVVALLRDRKTTEGSPSIYTDRFGYRYLFASDENQKAFLAAPQRYEVQLGGACGKMAELGGRGSTDRYFVHRRKLYIFASDGCLASFKTNPDGFLDRDDRPPTASQLDLQRGAQLAALARTWTGLNKLGTKKSLSLTRSSKLVQGQTTYNVNETIRIGPGSDYFELATYNGSGYGLKIENGIAFEIDPGGNPDLLVPTWKRALERRRARTLAYVLLTKPSTKNLFAFKSSSGGVAVVDAFVDRVTSTLRIQEGTGRVLGFATRGRDNTGVVGKIDYVYSEYATADGVTYPIAWAATYNGAEMPEQSGRYKLSVGG